MDIKIFSPKCYLTLIAGLVLLTCDTTVVAQLTIPKAIENIIRTNSGKVQSLSKVQRKPLSELKIDKKSKKCFFKSYKSFLSEFDKVQQDYKDYAGVATFTAIRYGDIVYTNKHPLATKAVNNPENSLYMAFALLTGAGVNYEMIGDRNHLKTLALSYGVSVPQIENGIWETLTRDWEQILGLVISMIDTNHPLTGTDEHHQFMTNVIHPYMTFLCRGQKISTTIENKVFIAFEKAFSSSAGKKRVFRDYVRVFKNYIEGKPMEVKYDIELNNHLKTFGFSISTGRNKCVTYELLDYRIPVKTSGIGEILLKKRVGVALLGTDLGQATYTAKDVTLTYDYLIDEANDISIVLSSDSLPKSYRPDANDLWKEIGCKMTVENANNLYRTLLRKEFHGKSQQEIVNLIVRQVSTHELKHKWDENRDPNRDWLNVDFEVSAHLTEIIYGGCPIYGLFNLINRTQRYYANINNLQVREKMKPLIIDAWKIAQDISDKEETNIMITKKMISIYSKYKTLRERKLPNLSVFKKSIIEGPLKSIAVLEI